MEKPARQLVFAVGTICEAGQHSACGAVGDPYDHEMECYPNVWVCACACHQYEDSADAE
jgi:hypothetical protein